MNRNTFRAFAAVLVVTGAGGCGGRTAGITATDEEGSTLSAIEQGATLQRAYLGVTQHVAVGARPVVSTFDLVGGSQVALEVASHDGAPLRFEVWRVRVDGTASLLVPIDSRSGFALQQIAPEEDGTWVLRFPAATGDDVVTRLDCVAGMHGCARTRQPGESCPAGWSCDVGLACQLPVGVCGPLAGVGTCAVQPTTCADDVEVVCGCDGRTYPSECAARLAGKAVLRAGSCDG
ncbi:MAG TPA: Kazal-type serine protease inhibitor domain-containing protein [Polyangiaceae bacterium]|jgi:hypothetical protein